MAQFKTLTTYHLPMIYQNHHHHHHSSPGQRTTSPAPTLRGAGARGAVAVRAAEGAADAERDVAKSYQPLTGLGTAEKWWQLVVRPGLSLDWFKGKSTGNHGFHHEIWGFPVKFPVNKSNESFNQPKSQKKCWKNGIINVRWKIWNTLKKHSQGLCWWCKKSPGMMLVGICLFFFFGSW